MRKGNAVLFVSAIMFNDIDDEDDEDAMETAAAVFATGDVTKADAVPTATRRAVDVITFIILGGEVLFRRANSGVE